MRLSREEPIPSVQREVGNPRNGYLGPTPTWGQRWEGEEPLPEAQNDAGAVLGQSAEVSAAEPSVPRQQPSPARSGTRRLCGAGQAQPRVRLIHSPHCRQASVQHFPGGVSWFLSGSLPPC